MPQKQARRAKAGGKAQVASLAALERRVRKIEKQLARLCARDEALDHSIEELAAAWVAESK